MRDWKEYSLKTWFGLFLSIDGNSYSEKKRTMPPAEGEERINILRACIVLTVMKLRVGVNQRKVRRRYSVGVTPASLRKSLMRCAWSA